MARDISSLPKPPIGDPCNGCGLCCRMRVCSMGSFALGLVERFGDRTDGPCPALTEQDGRFVCGLVARPKDWLPSHPKSVTALREAAKVLLGAGVGCDEAGDEPDGTALPKLDAIQQRYLERTGEASIRRAFRTMFG